MAATSMWVRGFALQALSDLRIRETLAKPETKAEKCHRLHFLQMATEKVCKAYLINSNGLQNTRKSHAYIQRILPILARVYLQQPWQIQQIRNIAREIELLAPACSENETRPDNSEYPWEDASGELVVPCTHNFPSIDEQDRFLVDLIRLLRETAEALRA